MAAVPGGLRRRRDHRIQLSRAGDEISARRGRRALHPQGVRRPLRDVHCRLRGHELGYHLRIDGLARLRRQPGAFVQSRSGRRYRHHGRRVAVHGRRRNDQLPRRRREREGERRSDLRRVERSADHHRDRPVGDRARARRRFARHPTQDRGRRERILAGGRRDDARLLRHGRFRGFRQHGGGMQGSDPHLSEGAARRDW